MFVVQLQWYYDRNEFLGLAGMVTLNNSETDGFNRIPTLDVTQVVTQDANDGGKRFLPQKWLGCMQSFLTNIFFQVHNYSLENSGSCCC